jgi:hypothetical protein
MSIGNQWPSVGQNVTKGVISRTERLNPNPCHDAAGWRNNHENKEGKMTRIFVLTWPSMKVEEMMASWTSLFGVNPLTKISEYDIDHNSTRTAQIIYLI